MAQDVGILSFNPDGSYNSSTPAALQNTNIGLTNGANPITVLHDFANNNTTQFAASFSVSTLDPDGFSTGRLTGLDISEDGLFRTRNGADAPADASVTVTSGALESSNVNAVDAMIRMIDSARYFEHQVKLMKLASENDAASADLMSMS